MGRTKELLQEYTESEQCANAEELFGYLVFEKGGIDRVVGIVAEKYAKECCEATLKEASKNAKISSHKWSDRIREEHEIKKESITNPNNIILL